MLDLQIQGCEFIQQLKLWQPCYAEPGGERELKRAGDDLVSLTGRAEIVQLKMEKVPEGGGG